MNFKFKQPPFYFYIILWIVALALGLQLDKKIQNLSDLFGLVVLIMPITFAYIWVLRNKIKIFKYYKKIRKKFKHIFYTIEGLVCVFIFSVIVSLISLGGYKNLKEKVLLEYIVWNDKNGLLCSPAGMYLGYGEYSKFFFKAETQYLDYFQFKPYSFVKEVYQLKNDTLFNFDHCKASRILLKEAHKGNQIAKDILAAYPITEYSNYFRINDKYIFQRYSDSLNKEKLYNPALVYAAAWNNSSDRLSYFKQAADEGYLLGMQDYLWEFSNEKFDIKIHRDECPLILKYVNHLKNENSLIESANIIWSLLGRSVYLSRAIYECSDKKTDFRKGILFMENFQSKVKNPKDTNNFVTTYPALIYFNGWGNVDKDKELALKLFKKNLEGSSSEISKAYLILNNLNNDKNDLKLLYEILVSEVTIYKPKRYIICNNVKYDFKIPNVDKENKQQKQSRKLQYLEPLETCLDNASREQRIESVKSYIKSWIDNWFQNPELVKTLNLYG